MTAAVSLVAGLLAVAPPEVAPPPREVKAVPQPNWWNSSADGEVTAVDARSITVRGFSWRMTGDTWRQLSPTGHDSIFTGNPIVFEIPGQTHLCRKVHRTRTLITLTLLNGDVVRIRREDQPARRFLVTEALAAGRLTDADRTDRSYRLVDIMINDEVLLVNHLKDGDFVCNEIKIRRRPGGRVPPLPAEKPDIRPGPYHEAMNAHQDYEDWGIPLPDKYDPDKIFPNFKPMRGPAPAKKEEPTAPPAKPKP